MNQNEMKLAAATYALDTFVKSGLKLGLGSGSTAEIFLAQLADRVKSGSLTEITCIPTSQHIAHLARGYGLRVVELNDVATIDLTIDGADEVVVKSFNLTKGRGGALLREKLVAAATVAEVIIADDTKLVNTLGEKMPIPVEVIGYGWKHTAELLRQLGGEPTLRQFNDTPYLTDSQNYILDTRFPPISNPAELALQIKGLVGVVEHGMFINMVKHVVIAGPNGAYELAKPA